MVEAICKGIILGIIVWALWYAGRSCVRMRTTKEKTFDPELVKWKMYQEVAWLTYHIQTSRTYEQLTVLDQRLNRFSDKYYEVEGCEWEAVNLEMELEKARRVLQGNAMLQEIRYANE